MLDPTCAHHAQHRERSPTAPAPAMTVQPRSRFPDAGQVACVKRARLGLEHAGDPGRRDRHAVDIPARPTGASAATATPPPSTRRAPVEPEPRTERRHRCERPAAPSDERPPPTPPSPSPIIQPAGWRRRQRPLPPRRRPRLPPRRSRLRGAVAETAGDEESSFRTRSQAATGHGRTAARMRTATARRPIHAVLHRRERGRGGREGRRKAHRATGVESLVESLGPRWPIMTHPAATPAGPRAMREPPDLQELPAISGEGGIRTPDGPKGPYRFSRPAHSTALPPLRWGA
jgi:hypothetical protein